MLLRDVHHDQPLMHVYLGSRQANTLGCVHGLQHVCNQLPDACIDRLNRAGHGVQTGIGITKDGKLGHIEFINCLYFRKYPAH